MPTINAMAGHKALAATGRSIVELLNRRYRERLPPPTFPTAVLAGTADFDDVRNSPTPTIKLPGVTVYCYRVSVDRETRPGWSAVAHGDGVPRVPLRMHLLISAWDTTVQQELEWLGLTISILERDSILTGPVLHSDGEWAPGDAVQLVADDLALDSMSEAFQALTTRYRLSLPYLARVIRIDAPEEATAPPVSTVSLGSGVT